MHHVGFEGFQGLPQAAARKPDRHAAVQRQPHRSDPHDRNPGVRRRSGAGGDDEGMVAGTAKVHGRLLHGVADAVDGGVKRLCHQGDPHDCDDGG